MNVLLVIRMTVEIFALDMSHIITTLQKPFLQKKITLISFNNPLLPSREIRGIETGLQDNTPLPFTVYI
jgi:hypothetical protein